MTMKGKQTSRDDANLSNLIYQKQKVAKREEKLNPGDAINVINQNWLCSGASLVM